MTIQSEIAPTQLRLGRPPLDKDELWELVRVMWGIRIPRLRVCPEHDAPFDAFAEAFFGNRANWVLWYGSRGTGKSFLLAILALTKAVTMDVNITLLGGSMAQSTNVHEHVEQLMDSPNAPVQSVAKAIKTELAFHNKNWVRPLPASSKTVRGPHPHVTLLDEIDEMERKIYDAAMGQAMKKPNALGYMVNEMTVASSTWQYPTGTFQEVRDDALLKGLPIRTWCYREVLKTEANPDGWMDPEFIERKRDSVPAEMFRVEYELGEPSGGSRAFDIEKVNEFFVEGIEPIKEHHKANDEMWEYEAPLPYGDYVAGADWAKEKDKTVIGIVRIDVEPARLVYLRVINRRAWPDMVEIFNKTMIRYHARGGHDATGVGNVVNDLVDDRVLKVLMVDQKRKDLLNEYISDFEQGTYRIPRSNTTYNAHRATTMDMIWSGAQGAGAHLPDEVAMMAIANRARRRLPPPVGGEAPTRDGTPSKYWEMVNSGPKPQEPSIVMVEVQEREDDVAVMWLP